MYYSYKGQTPISWDEFPHRIRLSSGISRTDKTTFSEEELADSGWKLVEDPPTLENVHKDYISWNSETLNWQILEYDYKEKIDSANNHKSKFLKIVDKQIEEYERALRLGNSLNLDLIEIKNYVELLESISSQENYPWSIEWPDAPNLKGMSSHGES